MKIHFHIEYRTVFGEEIVLNIVGNGDAVTRYRMTTDDGIYWRCSLNDDAKHRVLDYFYSVENNGNETRQEWRTVAHRLVLEPTKSEFFHVFNRWIDMPEDSYLYSSAFTDCLKSSEIHTSSAPHNCATDNGLPFRAKSTNWVAGTRRKPCP